MPISDFTNRIKEEERNKLPRPANKGLDALFEAVDKVVIIDDGVHEEKPIGDTILLTITDVNQIHELNRLLHIDEANVGFSCMCSGSYAIALYSADRLITTIGFHHGHSIRYYHWNGDAALAKSEELLQFLASLGFAQPLMEAEESRETAAADKIAEEKWLSTAPKCFEKYWKQICNMDSGYFEPLMSELNEEIPDKNNQIIRLLQTYGITNNFWNAYPVYEGLPNKLLLAFPLEIIIDTYLLSDRNYKTRRGLGRFLFSNYFRNERYRFLSLVTPELINDLEKCFASIGEKRGLEYIAALRTEKQQQL